MVAVLYYSHYHNAVPLEQSATRSVWAEKIAVNNKNYHKYHRHNWRLTLTEQTVNYIFLKDYKLNVV